MPSAINSSTWLVDRPVNKLPSLSNSPAVLVSNISFSACSTSATLPATKSALILYELPSSSTPIGAITGIKSLLRNMSSTSVLMALTSPTWPMSIISGASISGVWCVTFNCLAWMSLPSLPVKPMAWPPFWLMRLTMSLLTDPPSTISTTFMVAVSVTRMPLTKWESILSLVSKSPIWGPPPCTTTGFIPTNFIITMSRAKLFLRSSSIIALPPNLTTIVLPVKRWI